MADAKLRLCTEAKADRCGKGSCKRAALRSERGAHILVNVARAGRATRSLSLECLMLALALAQLGFVGKQRVLAVATLDSGRGLVSAQAP